jgi:hypothetical protein
MLVSNVPDILEKQTLTGSLLREDRSLDTARAIPCGHEFDTECLSTVLRSSGLKGRRCPLCRTHMQEIQYNFLPDGKHKTHLVDPTRPESPLMSGPFIQEDEELSVDMSPTKRSRVLELRRIRQGGPYNLKIRIHKNEAHGQRDDQSLTMRRLIELEICQDPYEASTKSTITRTQSIKFAPITPVIEPGNERIVPDDSEIIIRAEEKAKRMVKKIGVFHEQFTELSMASPEYKIPYDDKGLATTVKKAVTVTKVNGKEGQFTVSSTVELNEVYKVQPPDTQIDKVMGMNEDSQGEAIRLAREEIQGVLEFDFVHSGYRPLEGATTGIMEIRHEAECRYCEAEGPHRNGDCELSGISHVEVDD